MKSFKAGVIFTAGSLLCIVAFIIFTMSYRYDMNHMGDEMIRYTDTSREYSTRVYMDYNNSTYKVDKTDVEKLYKIITRGSSERRRLYKKPELSKDSVKVRFSSEIKVVVTPATDNPKDDSCYISYTTVENRDTRYYYLEGYDTYHWLQEIMKKNNGNQVIRKLRTD